MNKKTKLLAAMTLAGALAATGVYAGPYGATDADIFMDPSSPMIFNLGDKRALSYFEPVNHACALTVVVSDGGDAPGVRVVAEVLPGRKVQIDAANGKASEFFCGPDASRMSGKVVDRSPDLRS